MVSTQQEREFNQFIIHFNTFQKRLENWIQDKTTRGRVCPFNQLCSIFCKRKWPFLCNATLDGCALCPCELIRNKNNEDLEIKPYLYLTESAILEYAYETLVKLVDGSFLCETVKRLKFLKTLGQKSDENDDRTKQLADSLIRAYEFQTFHDVIDDIREAGDDPDKLEVMLSRLYDWKVLESRAILEIVRGRLSIINKLEKMIIEDAPETASSLTYDNLHDLLAEYPWLFNPDWQVFTEEKTISKQLIEWGIKECPEDIKSKRVDFLAFHKNTDELVIIEMKRPGHPVEMDEMQRLERYQVALMKARSNCKRVLVYGETVNILPDKWNIMTKAEDLITMTWSDMFKRAKTFYSHYEAVLRSELHRRGLRFRKHSKELPGKRSKNDKK